MSHAYLCCVDMFFCLNTNFVWSPNTTNICLVSSTIYIFIHVSGCVSGDPSALLFPGSYVALKTALQWFLATVCKLYECLCVRDVMIV
jgi:hypothetical protein